VLKKNDGFGTLAERAQLLSNLDESYRQKSASKKED